MPVHKMTYSSLCHAAAPFFANQE